MACARCSSVEVIQRPETAATALKGTRRSLLAALAEPDSAAGLARKLGIPRQRLNYHLKALEQCGLLECVEERRKGNCTERILRATARSFVISPDALGAFGPTPETAQDRFSASYVVAVAARTITEVSTLDARARAEQRRISTLTLDSEIRFASPSRGQPLPRSSPIASPSSSRSITTNVPRGRRFRLVTIGHPRPGPFTGRCRSAARAARCHAQRQGVDHGAHNPAARRPDRDTDAKTRSFSMSIDINATPEDVWRALTDAGELMRWFPLQARVTPGKGGSVFWGWISTGRGSRRSTNGNRESA